MQQIYTLGIYFFSFLIKVCSFFNSKAKNIVNGHVSAWQTIENIKEDSFIWFHVASLGEFEQGRPVIESLRLKYPKQKILITFFSPSGYQVKKNYSHADLVLYLPFDTPKNASRFLTKISIRVAIFVKYEFWFNYLNELQNNEIPIVYISSLFRKGQFYFRSNWMVGVFKKINHFFVQNEESRLILSSNGINNVTVSGDTRLDSAILSAGEKWASENIENSLDGRPVVVFGSTWRGDYSLITSFIAKHCSNYQFIIAPHEINEKEIAELGNSIQTDVSFFSNSEGFKDVIIIDSIGILKYLYRYADAAYIGGGFNSGIHNTLEPLVYGIPVLFGRKNHSKFTEAKNILELNLGAVVNSENFSQKLEFYLDSPKLRDSVKQNIEKYIENNKGATLKVLNMLESHM